MSLYPTELTQPLEAELTAAGFEALKTEKAVQQAIEQAPTALLVINSVCGCATGTARPGVLLATQTRGEVPAALLTVFAGVDEEAVAAARVYMAPYPPSSPCIAIFKAGKLVHFIDRLHIEGRSAEIIAEHLQGVFASL